MMQTPQNRPISRAWSFALIFICYMIVALFAYRNTNTFKAWAIVSSITALVFAIAFIAGKFVRNQKASALFTLLLVPIIVYPYAYLINLYLVLPLSYMTIYCSCAGAGIAVLLANKEKSKINKGALAAIILYYAIIGYITYRI